MKSRSVVASILAFGICATIAVAVAYRIVATPSPALIKYNLEAGVKCEYESEHEIDAHTNFQDHVANSKLSIRCTFEQTIDEVFDNGSATIRIKFSRIRMEIDGPESVQIDSANIDDKRLGDFAIFRIVNAEFTALLSPDGELTDFNLRDDILKELLKGPAHRNKKDVERDIRSLICDGFAPANRSIQVGESWSATFKASKIPAVLSVSNKFTYEGPGHYAERSAKIRFEPTVVLKAGKLITESGEGVCYFDLDNGRLLQSSLKQTIMFRIDDDGQPRGYSIHLTSVLRLGPL